MAEDEEILSESADDSTAEARQAPEGDSSALDVTDTGEQTTAEADGEDKRGKRRDVGGDPKVELLRLMDLAVKYPEIGPPLAELAFKIGQTDLAERIVRMGLDQEGPGLEYFFVAAHSARREQRYADARKLSIEAIGAFLRTPDESLAGDDGERLLHLIRLGYSTMLFDEKDPKCDPAFVMALTEQLPSLEPRLGGEAFYHALVAQTRWYDDIDASERAWDRAAQLDDTESTWNARGTWYKDASKDPDAAEKAYRRGLEKSPTSPLLLHNLGQLLVDKTERPEVDVEQSRRLLREAEQHLRAALREESPKGLRRHVHATMDRLVSLRSSLPPRGSGGAAAQAEPAEPVREPSAGEVLHGRVRSLTGFGAFVALAGCGTGLLHKSEIAHRHVEDPAELLKVGDEIEVKVMEVSRKDGKLRIALSRRALLPKPEGESATSAVKTEGSKGPRPDRGQSDRGQSDRGQSDRGRGRGRRDGQGDRGRQQDRGSRGSSGRSRDDDKLASLGEMLLAKMEKQKKEGS